MSQRDRDRLVVIRQVVRKEITVTRGGELLGLCREQVARIRDRYLVEGDRAVLHRARGRRPNNAKPTSWRTRVLERCREPQFHAPHRLVGVQYLVHVVTPDLVRYGVHFHLPILMHVPSSWSHGRCTTRARPRPLPLHGGPCGAILHQDDLLSRSGTMHELAVTRSILDIVVRHAAAHGVREVAAVHLAIGALSDLEPEWLQRYFDHLSRGTVADGAVLRVRRSALSFACDACGTGFDADREELDTARCPACGGRDARVVSGGGYTVESMEACA